MFICAKAKLTTAIPLLISYFIQALQQYQVWLKKKNINLTSDFIIRAWLLTRHLWEQMKRPNQWLYYTDTKTTATYILASVSVF